MNQTSTLDLPPITMGDPPGNYTTRENTPRFGGGGGQGRNEYQLLRNRRAIQPQEEELHTADIHFVPQQQKTRHNEEKIWQSSGSAGLHQIQR